MLVVNLCNSDLTFNKGGDQTEMETSWTIVTVMGKGNCERIVLPSTPLLELTMYQQMQTKMIRTNSRRSERDISMV